MNRHLLLAVAPWSGSSQSLGRWVSSHVVWYTGCAIPGKRGTVVFSWSERGQITVVLLWIPTSTSEGGGSGFTPGTGSTLSTRKHLIYRKNTEDVIQPRLREIDRFFFITRGRRLFTEVLAPDGIASGLAQVGLFMGDKNAPDEFGAVFRVQLTRGKLRSRKEWWHFWAQSV